MNKKIIGLSIISALMGAASVANAASTGTITFNGELTDSTCDVAVDGGAADATVTLPTTPSSALADALSQSGRTAFKLSLSNCVMGTDSGETMVSAYFQAGSTVDSATGLLNNMATGDTAATNVQLGLLDGTTNKQIKVGSASQMTDAGWVTPDTNGAVELPYAVTYWSQDGGATAGLVSSKVIYNLQYK